MKIKKFFGSTVIMIAVLSLACVALAISWPEWRDDLRAQGYYGYGFDLPDTGQTRCYQGVSPYAEIPCAGTGQDGAYNINFLSYADNGDGTVTDNNTGLMWQQGENSLIGYNWYQASGTYHGTYNPTSQNVCGDFTLGEHSDWRLPTKKELLSIVDYSIPSHGPTINTTYFPNAHEDYYWSSTTDVFNTSRASKVAFYAGYVLSDSKYDNYSVRCVRGGELEFGNFVNNYDGTITDTSTGLMWQQGEPGDMSWASALSYCEDLELPSGSGQTDWRLPNIKELDSITDDYSSNPAIDTTYFPIFDTFHTTYHYWSSSTFIYETDRAWDVDFTIGRVSDTVKGAGLYVRCVRGGQLESFGNLTITKSGTGSGTVTSYPSGINCGSDCSETYDLDTVVNLAATPSTGSIFTSWSGDSDCSDSSVIMNADKTCIANFRSATYEEYDPAITYKGAWSNYTCASCSGWGLKYSPVTGAKATFSFNGTGIKWIFTKAKNLGKANVYLDGVYKGLIDQYSATTKFKQSLQKTGLAPGTHTVAIEVSGHKYILSTGYSIDVDAFEVVP